MLIKIILLAYSRSIIHSRKIEAACRENVLFVAVSGDSQPHFTTLAAFVSGMGDLAAKLFAQVLFICDRQGLIGREMFAIDGVKLPANASKAKSGNLKALAAQQVNAYVPDNGYRKRDEGAGKGFLAPVSRKTDLPDQPCSQWKCFVKTGSRK